MLVDGDFVLAESDAILWYIGERFPDARLLPAGGAGDLAATQARARVLQWCDFASTGLYQTYVDIYIHKIKARARPTGELDRRGGDAEDGSPARRDGRRAREAARFSRGISRWPIWRRRRCFTSVKARMPGDPTSGRAAIAAWYERVTGRASWREAMASAEAAS